MGMDVYGKNPKNEKGEYFRNNVWWWHPLWDYCLNNHPEIAQKVKHGHSNDGDGLDSADAYKLGILLRQDYHSGFAKDYEKKYAEYIENLPLEDCTICNQTGKLTFKSVGSDSEEEVRECGRCNGTGKAENWFKNYPFSIENLKEFSEFCINSGGFSIC